MAAVAFDWRVRDHSLRCLAAGRWHDRADFGCQPVMSLTSSLIAVREHKAGEPVGYGGTRVSERDTRLGVVAMGYGDGYPRAAPSGTPVLVNGRECRLSGESRWI